MGRSRLSPANQKEPFPVCVFRDSTCHLNDLKHSETGISEKLRIFPARDLARSGSRARSCSHETLELGERESPFDCAFRSYGPRGDRVSYRRALGADARSFLRRNRDCGRNAIQSRRYANALHRMRVIATVLGASVGAVEANYFGANLIAFMLAIFFIGLLRLAFGWRRPLIDMPALR